MTAIRERTILSVIDLPKKLTSRRNLLAHFSKYGEVMNVSVKKDLKSAMIQFASHFDAQAAKSQGKLYENEPLNIFWSGTALLDPRARGKQEYEFTENEPLWQDDDKECFGVETVVQQKAERKQLASDLIKDHLKVSTVKRRLGLQKAADKDNSEGIKKRIPTKVTKGGQKSSISLKKSLLTVGSRSKRKLDRKEGETLTNKSKKTSLLEEHTSKPTALVESMDLKLKLAMLDERDKIIRSETVQDSDIKTAVAIKGTCPDMCPERERLLRQCGHAVAIYEMLPGSSEMDECRAVKEYIRSSADQEVPLPHDLRPEPVLSMTMNYLITNIITRVDNPNENKAVWYSFCWNRLRSVRKDIILQQLCDMETVKIVEQCARFHISCYDHMWGAEVSGFDDKINTQNLIDCLQTLRHMYEDLEKHNVTCPNKAEFNSYLILLKLKSGDVMWEYQQYSLKIQLSPHMQFAIEAYMAFKNNMYSRFFNLVKKASYLTACLMQRYFSEVRSQALRTMLRAYCLPGKNVGLSSSFIVSSLKFDSLKNALKFCEREEVDVKIDLDVNEEDVYVANSSFLIREKRLPIVNAVVGENNPLPPTHIPHDVHSSFDEHGKLKDDSFSATSDRELSDDQLYADEQSEEATVPKSSKQPSTFKFSLSPTKTQENLFGKLPLSSKAGEHTQLTDEIMTEMQLPIFVNPNIDQQPPASFKSYESPTISIDSYDMEEDVRMDTMFEVNKEQLGHTSPIHQSPIGLSEEKPTAFNNPFLIQSISSSNESRLETKGNNIHNTIKSPVLATKDTFIRNINYENNSNFSFSLSSNQALPNNFPTHSSENLAKSITPNMGSIQCGNNTFEKTINLRNTDQTYEETKQNEVKELQIKLDNEKRKEEEAATRKKILLETLLKEEAEKERLKIEHQKKEEAEKIRKKMEEKKVYQNLKKNLSKRLKADNARKYGRQWKQRVEKLKKTRADFPMLVQLSVSDHLSLWGKVNNVPSNNISQRVKDKKNLCRIISQLMLCGISDSCKYIGSNLAEAIAQSAVDSMKKGGVKPIYWKLAISVPWESKLSSELSVFNKLMKRWCQQSFYSKPNFAFGSVECVATSLEIPVNMSIHFSDSLQSSHRLQAMNALVFVVLNKSETEKKCLQRLRTLVTSQAKSEELAVAVMNVGGANLERALKIELEELHEQNLIAFWKVNNWSSPKSISDSLHFLAEHFNVDTDICASSLELLVKQVSEEFFDALSAGRHSSIGLMEALKNPNNVITFYNTCLNKIEDLLVSSKLEKYFNIAKEFKVDVPLNEAGGPELMCGQQCNSSYKTQITEKIKLLKLPELTKWPPTSPNRLVKIIKVQSQHVHDLSTFPQVIRMLDLPDEGDFVEHLEQVAWVDIVELWSKCSQKHIFQTKEKCKKLFVMYNKSHIQGIIKKQWWLKLPIVVHFENIEICH